MPKTCLARLKRENGLLSAEVQNLRERNQEIDQALGTAKHKKQESGALVKDTKKLVRAVLWDVASVCLHKPSRAAKLRGRQCRSDSDYSVAVQGCWSNRFSFAVSE